MANHYKTSNKTIAMRGQSLWETRAAFLIVLYVGCATDEVKLLVKSVCETAPKSLSCPPPPPPPLTPVYNEQNRTMISGSLSKDDGDGDGNENSKKAIGLDWRKNNFARASRFFISFFAVTA